MRLRIWLVTVATVAAACSGGTTETTRPQTTSPPVLETSTSGTVVRPVPDVSASPTTTADPQKPRQGGAVVVGLSFVPMSVNELDDGGFAAARWIRNLVRPGGYVLSPDGTRRPHLVSRDPVFEDGGFFIAEDGTFEVTWSIDREARWSDGERVVARDFALFHEADCGGDNEFSGEFVDADPGQVRVRFPAPTPTFREALEHVMPSHVIEPGTECFDDGITWPSTGPFVIESVGGSGMELVRNAAYWLSDPATGVRLPYLDAITLRTTEDIAESLASGAIDVGDGLEPALRGAGVPEDVVVETAPGSIWEFLTFQFGPDNRNAESLNEHLTFRQAVIHAIDRAALAEAVGWMPSDGLGAHGVVDAWSPYDHDQEEARALLEDLCTELGRDCEIDPPVVTFSTTANAADRARVAEMLQQMWEEVGIAVELELEDSTVFFDETAALGTYDVGMWAWVVEPDPVSRIEILGVFDPSDPGPDGRNWYRWGTPGSTAAGDAAVDEFSDLLEAASLAIDAETMNDLLARAEHLLADELVVIPIATRPVAVARVRSVEGPVPAPPSLGLLWNAEFWHRVGASP